MKPTIFAQVRRGANPALGSPEGYRTAERSGASLRDSGALDLSALLLSCMYVPTQAELITDASGVPWRKFECEHISDSKHTRRSRSGRSGEREYADYPWEHQLLMREVDWVRLQAKTEALKHPKPTTLRKESNFQTRRIQIATVPHRSYVANDYLFAVIVYDTLTRQVIEVWEKTAWTTNFSQSPTVLFSAHQITYKKDALATAKSQAQARNLPFSESVDIVTWADALEGPEQPCAVCGGKTHQRGYESTVCADCRITLNLGRDARVDRIVVDVPLEDVLSELPGSIGAGARTEDQERHLIAQLLGLCGVTLPLFGDGELDLPQAQYRLKAMFESSFGSRSRYQPVLLKRTQFEQLCAIVETMRDLVILATDHAHTQGRSLLQSLAEGDLTSDMFDDEITARARRTQEHFTRAHQPPVEAA